ncbi:MAG: hypothetical protein FJY74_04540 [Candidatus Eisenbacteria bacterium]|nr:hypothetical protein [Candidatus Eisenbacteria bacterium]
MPHLTVGEVRTHLAQCRANAQALLTKVQALPPGSRVTGIVSGPVPLPMAICKTVTAPYLVAADYAEGLAGIIQWLDDLTATLQAPDSGPFAQEKLA